MPIFNGQLKTNKVYNGTLANAIFNMIISQRIFDVEANAINSLVERATEEAGMLGSTKLYYSTDVLESYDFLAMSEQDKQNVLATARPKNVTVQALEIDKARQIDLTIDDPFTKQGFATEGAYSQLMSAFMGAMQTTRKLHNALTYNTFIGTDKNATATHSSYTIDVASTDSKEVVATEIAEGLANLMTELADPNRDYTDTKYMRSYNVNDLTIVWNASFRNMIQKRVLPVIFSPDKLDTLTNDFLPSRFFGTVSSATSSVEGARTLIERKVGTTNYFPGDVLPTGTQVEANTTYTVNPNVICKVMHKDSVPFLSGYATTESFRNARAHNTNYYLLWVYNTLEHLVDKPMLEVLINQE